MYKEIKIRVGRRRRHETVYIHNIDEAIYKDSR